MPSTEPEYEYGYSEGEAHLRASQFFGDYAVTFVNLEISDLDVLMFRYVLLRTFHLESANWSFQIIREV
jgi:hypothetical protein